MLYRSEGEEEGLKVRAAAEEQKARILARAIEFSQALPPTSPIVVANILINQKPRVTAGTLVEWEALLTFIFTFFLLGFCDVAPTHLELP
jgi:hypothetical protein